MVELSMDSSEPTVFESSRNLVSYQIPDTRCIICIILDMDAGLVPEAMCIIQYASTHHGACTMRGTGTSYERFLTPITQEGSLDILRSQYIVTS